MTIFEIIIICIVAALFVATIFVFIVCISYIKQVQITNKQVVTLTNAIFECRSFLEKLSKHDVITKINNISGLEKKVVEVLSICKNQTNNITQVRDNLDKSLDDIKMRNNMIRDTHKLLDSVNVKTSKMQDDINKIGEIVVNINKPNFINYDKIVEDITYIREKLGETSVDSEKEVININKKLEDILSFTKRCNSGVSSLIEAHNKNIDVTRESFKVINDTLSNINDNIDKKLEDILSWIRRCKGGIETLIDGHNKGINATSKAFDVINSRNDVTDNAIDKTYNDVKSVLKDIAKISSVLDSYREKINYITTYIENATKLKTASKTKMAQSKIVKTPAKVKGM